MLHPTAPTTWLEYKQKRNRVLTICLGGFLAAVLISLLIPRIAPIVGTIWFVGSIWSSMALSYFKCPRCGKPFIMKESGGYNGFTKKCLNCGLSKWADPG